MPQSPAATRGRHGRPTTWLVRRPAAEEYLVRSSNFPARYEGRASQLRLPYWIAGLPTRGVEMLDFSRRRPTEFLTASTGDRGLHVLTRVRTANAGSVCARATVCARVRSYRAVRTLIDAAVRARALIAVTRTLTIGHPGFETRRSQIQRRRIRKGVMERIHVEHEFQIARSRPFDNPILADRPP